MLWLQYGVSPGVQRSAAGFMLQGLHLDGVYGSPPYGKCSITLNDVSTMLPAITHRNLYSVTAARCCHGRVVSVLEGGYNLNGGLVSAFARSVAAHVRALAQPHTQAWDPLESKLERDLEHKKRDEKLAKAAARAAVEASNELKRQSHVDAVAASTATAATAAPDAIVDQVVHAATPGVPAGMNVQPGCRPWAVEFEPAVLSAGNGRSFFRASATDIAKP